MSRRIKKRMSVSERKLRREIQQMAGNIDDDVELRAALEQADPADRSSMLLTIAPYLSFVPSEEILACGVCGAFRGALRAHACDPGADHPKPGSEAFEKMVDQIVDDQSEPLFTAARGHGFFRLEPSEVSK